MNVTDDVRLKRIAAAEAIVEKRRRAAKGNLLAYIKYNMPDFKIGWHHREIIGLITASLRNERKDDKLLDRILIVEPPRHGKALCINTPIPTPEGYTALDNLNPGDYVFDENGKPTKILAKIYWKDRPIYKVTTKEGACIYADEQHEWLIRPDRKKINDYRRKTTKWIAKPRKNQRGFRVEFTKPLQTVSYTHLTLPTNREV